VNQSKDKYSSAVSQAEKQKTNNLKGGHGHGRSSCTPPGKPACSTSSLKRLYTNACSMGDKQEELAMTSLQLQRHSGTACMTGMLSWMATDSLGKTDQQGEVLELLYV